MSRYFELTLLICLGLAMPLTVFAPQIVTWLFGPVFAPAAPVLEVLAWSTMALLLSQLLGHGLIAAGRQKINSLLYVIALVFGLAANFLLVPSLLHLGAAWSALLTETSIALGALLAVWKLGLLPLELKLFPRILLLAGAYFVTGICLILIVRLIRILFRLNLKEGIFSSHGQDDHPRG